MVYMVSMSIYDFNGSRFTAELLTNKLSLLIKEPWTPIFGGLPTEANQGF